MTIEASQRKTGKGKTMIEEIRKITCDGCGESRTFVLGKDKRHEHPPWYRIHPEVDFFVVGQAVKAESDLDFDATNYPIHACSRACAVKAFEKRLPNLPDRLPPLK